MIAIDEVEQAARSARAVEMTKGRALLVARTG
jgi:hypothetical protein